MAGRALFSLHCTRRVLSKSFLMPYSPNRQKTKDTPLTDAEREKRIKALQAEQGERLRRGLGDKLYDWLESFDNGLDGLNRGLSQRNRHQDQRSQVKDRSLKV